MTTDTENMVCDGLRYITYSRRDPAGREITTGGIDRLVVPVLLGQCNANPRKLEVCVNSMIHHDSQGLPNPQKTRQIRMALISSLPRVVYDPKMSCFKVRDGNKEILRYRSYPDTTQRAIIPHIREEDYFAGNWAYKIYAFFIGIGNSSKMTQAVREGRLHRFCEAGVPPERNESVQLYLLAEVNRLKAES